MPTHCYPPIILLNYLGSKISTIPQFFFLWCLHLAVNTDYAQRLAISCDPLEPFDEPIEFQSNFNL